MSVDLTHEADIDDLDTLHPLMCSCDECVDDVICELYTEPYDAA